MSAMTQTRSGGGKNATKQPHMVFLDYLRAFAPLAVVGVHVCMRATLWSNPLPDMYSGDYYLLGVITRVLRLAVPVFCMISGAIFLDPRRPFNYRKHYLRTVPRILIIFLAWSLIYATIVAILSKGSGHDRLMVFIENSVSGFWHLWYLKMLIAVYLIVPILRKITEDRKVLRIAVGLIIFCFSMITLGWILSALVSVRGEGGLVAHIAKAINLSAVNVAEFMWVGYIAYFIVGYYLATERFSRAVRRIIYAIGAGGLVMTIVFSVARSRATGFDFAVGNDALGDLGMLFYASAVFLAVREAMRRKRKTGRIVAFMAKHSLGVYVIHALFILLACKFFALPSWHPWSMFILIPGLTLITYVASLLLAWLFSKIPLVKKVV